MIAKYDTEMTTLSTRLKEVQEKYDVELSQYQELKEYFEKIDLDKSIEASEEREIALERQKEEEEKKRLEKTVTHLQARWRGRKARHEFISNKGKGGKKGKKKGGGGKKRQEG